MSWKEFSSIKQDSAKAFRWPTRKDENWKYLSFSHLNDFAIKAPPAALQPVSQLPETKLFSKSVEVQIRDQKICIADVATPGLKIERVLRSQEPSSHFQMWLEKFNLAEKNVTKTFHQPDLFETQNENFWQEGLFISIDENFETNQILVLRFHCSDAGASVLPRVWISVAARASAQIIETYEGAAKLLTPVTKIELQASAQLQYIRKSELSAGSTLVSNVRILQHQSSNLHSLSLLNGTKLARENFDLHLIESGATAKLTGLSFASGEEAADHHTTVDHVVGHCQTSQLYKNIVSDEAKAIFNGRVLIRHNAQEANSEQLSQSLILSSKAEVDSKPQLEIWADNVKATHGATVGQLNEEEIFYLVSRGISRAQAEAMIRQGFSSELVLQIENLEIQNWLQKDLVRLGARL